MLAARKSLAKAQAIDAARQRRVGLAPPCRPKAGTRRRRATSSSACSVWRSPYLLCQVVDHVPAVMPTCGRHGGASPTLRLLRSVLGFCRPQAEPYGKRRSLTNNFRGWATGGDQRVMRGGSAWNDAENARSAYRRNRDPEIRNQNQGFRVLLPAAPSPRLPKAPSRPVPGGGLPSPPARAHPFR